jgi:hypothetical protein
METQKRPYQIMVMNSTTTNYLVCGHYHGHEFYHHIPQLEQQDLSRYTGCLLYQCNNFAGGVDALFAFPGLWRVVTISVYPENPRNGILGYTHFLDTRRAHARNRAFLVQFFERDDCWSKSCCRGEHPSNIVFIARYSGFKWFQSIPIGRSSIRSEIDHLPTWRMWEIIGE